METFIYPAEVIFFRLFSFLYYLLRISNYYVTVLALLNKIMDVQVNIEWIRHLYFSLRVRSLSSALPKVKSGTVKMLICWIINPNDSLCRAPAAEPL